MVLFITRLTLRQKDPSAYDQPMRFLAVITLALLVLTGCQTFGPRLADHAAELKRIRPLAEQGDAKAQTRLGEMYRWGWGVTQDKAEAVRWWRKAAKQGHARTQYELGRRYYRGWGVPQDYKEAARWYRKAAEQGLARAQSNLGVMYEKGYGVTQVYKEAVRWYRMAAKQGDAYAQYWLGEMYRDGEGVMQDRVMTIILLCYQGQIRVNPCRRKCFWRSRTCSHTS